MNDRLIISLAKEKIAKEEFGYLRQDWELLKHCFVATVTVSPFAILGIFIFGPAVIASLLFAVSRITFKLC